MSGPVLPGSALPGSPVTATELRELGFAAHELRFDADPVAWPGGIGLNWTTLGEVPESPGMYAFTVAEQHQLHVAYVGLTTHLWMITKGRMPRSGGARGGQRYGRPKHAGITRKRIDALIAVQVAAGRIVTHWLAPTPAGDIVGLEEQLIARWNLRVTGWNRG